KSLCAARDGAVPFGVGDDAASRQSRDRVSILFQMLQFDGVNRKGGKLLRERRAPPSEDQRCRERGRASAVTGHDCAPERARRAARTIASASVASCSPSPSTSSAPNIICAPYCGSSALALPLPNRYQQPGTIRSAASTAASVL